MSRLAVVTLIVLAACSGSDRRVDGVVIAVDGGLGGVSRFEIVTAEGARFEFRPGVARFADGAPLSHLHEHLQTGAPVRVIYREEGGVLVALSVDDVP